MGDKHGFAHQPRTYAHMAATVPRIGGAVATVRSALLQSLRCLPRRIRIRAQSHTTQVYAHDGNHVRSTFAHQHVTVTFHECVIARKTCCSNGLGSHLNADQREQGTTLLMAVGALCIRHPTQSSSWKMSQNSPSLVYRRTLSLLNPRYRRLAFPRHRRHPTISPPSHVVSI